MRGCVNKMKKKRTFQKIYASRRIAWASLPEKKCFKTFHLIHWKYGSIVCESTNIIIIHNTHTEKTRVLGHRAPNSIRTPVFFWMFLLSPIDVFVVRYLYVRVFTHNFLFYNKRKKYLSNPEHHTFFVSK